MGVTVDESVCRVGVNVTVGVRSVGDSVKRVGVGDGESVCGVAVEVCVGENVCGVGVREVADSVLRVGVEL